MGRRYKFRKVYFVCTDNSVLSEYTMITCFKNEAHAKEQELFQQQKANDNAKMESSKNQLIPVMKAHGFYLVHESLFDEILKEHS